MDSAETTRILNCDLFQSQPRAVRGSLAELGMTVTGTGEAGEHQADDHARCTALLIVMCSRLGVLGAFLTSRVFSLKMGLLGRNPANKLWSKASYTL